MVLIVRDKDHLRIKQGKYDFDTEGISWRWHAAHKHENILEMYRIY